TRQLTLPGGPKSRATHPFPTKSRTRHPSESVAPESFGNLGGMGPADSCSERSGSDLEYKEELPSPARADMGEE
ncbi:MAG TPA: hypothetical protein VMF69_29105, partial [Gemmataceae bacterium]|nr:hypothetical protein [Gemmataceae bacterium]